MQLIPNWFNKQLTCAKCGTTKSVKYMLEGKPYCNKCILPLAMFAERVTKEV